jgi:hypothetical protein
MRSSSCYHSELLFYYGYFVKPWEESKRAWTITTVFDNVQLIALRWVVQPLEDTLFSFPETRAVFPFRLCKTRHYTMVSTTQPCLTLQSTKRKKKTDFGEAENVESLLAGVGVEDEPSGHDLMEMWDQ